MAHEVGLGVHCGLCFMGFEVGVFDGRRLGED